MINSGTICGSPTHAGSGLVSFAPLNKTLFLLAVFCLPLTNVGVWDVGVTVTLSKLFLGFIVIHLLLGGLVGQRIPFVWTSYSGSLITFLIYAFVAAGITSFAVPADTITAGDVGVLRSPQIRSLGQLLNLTLVSGMYVLSLLIVRDRGTLEQVVDTLLLSCFLVSAYGVYQYVGSWFSWPGIFIGQLAQSPSFTTTGAFRVNSTCPEGKDLAFFLTPVILMLLFLLVGRGNKWSRKRRCRWLLLLLILVLSLTYSRSGWILILVSLILLSPILLRRMGITSLGKVVFVGGVLAVGYMAFGQFTSRFATTLGARVQETSLERWSGSIEFPILVRAIEVFREHPVLGTGYGNFPFYLNQVRWARSWDSSTKIHAAPSQFVMLLVETGVVGFCLFVWFALGTVISCGRRLREITDPSLREVSSAFFGAAVAVVVVLQYTPEINRPFSWFILGMLQAAVRLGLNTQEAAETLVITGPDGCTGLFRSAGTEQGV